MELIKLLLLLNYNSNITIEQNFQHENNLFSKTHNYFEKL